MNIISGMGILAIHSDNSAFLALPLRARKAALVRARLLDAILERLAHQPLAAVSVRECCEQVGVSEPTFFNYFAAKSGALMHYIALWSVESQWHLRRATTARDGLAGLFTRTASGVRAARWLMPEVIQYQFLAAAPGTANLKPPPSPPTRADKLLHFADLDGAVELEPRGVRSLIRDALARAAAGGELGPDADLRLAEQLLLALFFGATASSCDPDEVADTMTRGLAAIWSQLAIP